MDKELAAEIEKERLDKLRKLEKSIDPVGDFSMHEALDRASIVMEMVDDYLLGHQSIINNPDFYQRASQIHTELYELYNAIGNAHL